ncbi:MAG: SDR family oxidoreductase [Sphingobium sp.]|uniref:SDR family NAD(P)-dependent oxidoreductase n=1 Tax=Sphingobium sp. TaxID=1912891 RepID=UPI0029BD6C48|nr:SDR family oxidoreductase [Sphingobium sp.]MDX3910593.1 SDR family oxidoreductase [Sphingobium sp.]
MSVEGKKMLIVGGGAGIGAAIGVEAARQGAEIAIADLSTAALRETETAIESIGGIAHTSLVDIGDDASVARMGEWAKGTIGSPDILLVTVIDYPGSFSGLDDMDVNEWRRSFEVNFFGYIRVVEQFLAEMRARGSGTIVLTASTVALLPDPTAAVLLRYKAIKHALFGLSQALAVALKGSGLRSVCFCPSLTATPGTIDNLRSSGLEGVEDILAIAAQPDDVARFFLAELAKDEFLICAHAGYRDLLVEYASNQLDPAPFISQHFPSAA